MRHLEYSEVDYMASQPHRSRAPVVNEIRIGNVQSVV